MLVLTRREGESIMIGEDVEIEVVEIRRGKVRLGVRAPIAVAVHRREVFEKVVAEREAEKYAGGGAGDPA